MKRIEQLFRDKQTPIVSVFYPAGFPSLEDTLPVLKELQVQGADMVEIGIPFSDPLADGPVIQRASTQALRNGITLQKIFDQLKDLRPQIHIPVILMGYLNPIMHFGFEAFCEACRKSGVDGMIIPDLPFQEYMDHYKEIAEKYALDMIMLITPETSEERIRNIDAHTSGYIYMVSSAATTGAQKSFDPNKQAYFQRIHSLKLKNPRLIGFGVSNKQTFDAACTHAAGAIIGSHFVQLLETRSDIRTAVTELMRSIQE